MVSPSGGWSDYPAEVFRLPGLGLGFRLHIGNITASVIKMEGVPSGIHSRYDGLWITRKTLFKIRVICSLVRLSA